MTTAPGLAAEAAARAARGDDTGAGRLFDEGLARFPGDARFINSAGNFHAKAGRDERALALFQRALAVSPGLLEAAVNAAISLQRLGRAGEAVSLLRAHENHGARDARYWSTRGNAERASGDFAAATNGLERALRLSPTSAAALAGRARIALERGEARAVDDHERALAQRPGDPQLIHDYAQALAEAGRSAEATALSGALAGQLPHWIQGLTLHAALRWATGERDRFADHFAAAAREAPTPAVSLAWADALAGVDRQREAVEVLTQARTRWPGDGQLALAHAVATGESGDGVGAEELFAAGAAGDTEWDLARARNLLRLGRPAIAEALLAPIAQADLANVTAWALRDVAWRVIGDPRHEWLHGQPGLVRSIDFALPDIAGARMMLEGLHEHSGMPIGQSVKYGSQTRGALFNRCEPQIASIRTALERVLAEYRAGLPTGDPTHPLLSRRDAPWAITGSWSIRFDGGGHHAAHIHPKGVVSTASYFVVPGEVDEAGAPGWLELGRPPPEMAVPLDALSIHKPREGSCVLFPSTLFHGTRPIRAGRRMTIAFDVTA